MKKDTFTVCVRNYDGYDLASTSEEPYYMIGFYMDPKIADMDIPLQSGHVLKPREKIAYISGPKTSAGFNNLSPVPSVRFEYLGVFEDKEKKLVLWQPYVNDEKYELHHDDYKHFYYAHHLGELVEEEPGHVLIFCNLQGSGRVIETKEFYQKHEDMLK